MFCFEIKGNGDTPLHIVCDKGHLSTCKILLENGANINTADSGNRLPIHRYKRLDIRGEPSLKILPCNISYNFE